MTIYFNYPSKKSDFFQKKMREPTQLKPFYDRGFRPLQTMSVFRTSDNINVIENIAKKWSVDSWTEHENIFVLVHVNTGFLGYFRLKRFLTSNSEHRFEGLVFVDKKNDEMHTIPLKKIRTTQCPKGEYIIMTIPADHIVVAHKGNLTLKMWF